ncbi:MAG: phospho-sugar mutase [Bacillales bacterium]|jgi:phosphoglucomutase|nr:phospho-sugar mutase [Bacillales bacterium]
MKAVDLYTQWLKVVSYDDLKTELLAIKGNNSEIEARFSKELEFGTAGLRGILGVGSNYINVYTIRRTTRALASYMLNHGLKKVVISYDSRKFSYDFAHDTAEVLAFYKIKTFFCTELQPTPVLSYLVRQLQTDIGIMITASHNPANYNGYKVYDNTGGQISLETAQEISDIASGLPYFSISRTPFHDAFENGLIENVPEELYQKFLRNAEKVRTNNINLAILSVIYTPLNGTGYKMDPFILRKNNIHVSVVEPQSYPDYTFKTCPFPNPELISALQLGIDKMKETDADLLLATDPDCDRVGLVVMHKGKAINVNGNEIGILLTDYLLQNKKLPNNPVFMKSIVSTPLVEKICEANKVKIYNLLTGFKYVGATLNILEKEKRENDFVLAFEESNGYLALPYIRDKDGVASSLLITEMAGWYKQNGKSLIDRLEEIYAEYGYYESITLNYDFPGINGVVKMNQIMNLLRNHQPLAINYVNVYKYIDYSLGVNGLDKSNVLEYNLDNEEKFIIRPSGTESKIKVYLTLVGDKKHFGAKQKKYVQWLNDIFYKEVLL